VPPDATPWQRLYRKTVNSLAEGATLEGATEFRRIAKNPPRHNH
jgi:xylonate dehydratase